MARAFPPFRYVLSSDIEACSFTPLGIAGPRLSVGLSGFAYPAQPLDPQT